MNATHTIDIVLHVTIIICALSVLFWFVITKEEDNSGKNIVKNAVKTPISNIATSGVGSVIVSAIGCDSEYSDVLEQSSSFKDAQDKWAMLVNKLYVASLVVLFATLVLYTKFVCKQDINVGEILYANIGVLVVVAGFEYYFFKNIASKYRPVVPSFAEKRFFDTLTN